MTARLRASCGVGASAWQARLVCLALLLVPVGAARDAAAQTGAYISVGPSGGANIATSDQLTNTRSLGLAFRIPRPKGISFAWDLGSQTSDFTDPSVPVAPLGELTVRPFLAGIAVAHRAGRLETVLTLTTGYAKVGFELSDAGRAALEPRLGAITDGARDAVAVFPKLTLYVDLTRRFGLTVTSGYLLTRSTITLEGPLGSQEIAVNADALKVNAGVVIRLF